MFDLALGHVESCSALRVALGARVGHERRVPSLSTDVVAPFLLVEVRRLTLIVASGLVRDGSVAATSVPT